MKLMDINNSLDKIPGTRIKNNETFLFKCHSDLSCFNLCCRNINLFLYPYDLLRLKNRLNISSDSFLDQYTDIVLRPSTFFPDVLLKMSENQGKTCPFLDKSGCTVYPDRPDTCRTFPVEQGVIFHENHENRDNTELISFFRPPDFCLGQHENKTWTTKTWAENQEAMEYNKMTRLWGELRSLFQTDPWGREGEKSPKAKMAFMAIYNLDMFRDFMINSSFFKRYKVKPPLKKKLKKDDVELMLFGFEWIKFFVWGIKSKKFRLSG